MRIGGMVAVMMVSLTAVCSAAAGSGEQPEPDYELRWSNLIVNRLTADAIAEIEAMENRGDLTVVTARQASPELLTGIGKLTWIRKLRIQPSEAITSLEPLAGLTELTELSIDRLGHGEPLDLTPLASLDSLEDLAISTTPVSHTEALAGLTGLRGISLYMARVESIDFLKSTPDVEVLDLYGTDHTFPDYAPLASLTRLRHLTIYGNPQATDENLSALAGVTSLESVRMDNCPKVSTLSFLRNCRKLEAIHAKWCRGLTDISALADLPALQVLEIEDAPISSIAPLKGKTRLRSLNISETGVEDLSPLAGCTGLEDLSIREIPAADLSALYGLPELDSLKVSSTVSEQQRQAITDAIPDLRLSVFD